MVYAGFANTFIPEAQKALQSDYSRDVNKFPLNKYATIVPTDKKSGYYNVHDPDEESRINYTNGADALWADGSYAPDNFKKGHSFTQYTTTRYAFGFTIGDQAEKQADWSLVADHADGAARRLMTLRTQLALTALDTSGNWATGHTDTCTNIAGGKFDVATTSVPYIKKGIQAGIRLLEKSTNCSINHSDLILLVSSDLAMRMSQSAEIIDHVKSSPFAMPILEGVNFAYGLPDSLYGVKIVVENSVKNTAKKGAARAGAYIAGDNAWLLVRPGGVVSSSINTMSTLTLPMFEEMQVGTRHDDFHRLTEGVVSDDFAVIVRGNLGVRFTDCSAA